MGKKRWRQGFGGDNRKTWKQVGVDVVDKMDLQDKGWNGVFLIHVTQDREKWRALANGPFGCRKCGKICLGSIVTCSTELQFVIRTVTTN
jgi:hypothetical protein